jgi:hypothetical protein
MNYQMRLQIFLGLLVLLCPFISFADNEKESVERKAVLSGYITDKNNGEALLGATVYVEELGLGTITNIYGFYSIALAPGDYNVRYTYIGFETQNIALKIQTDDISRNIELGKYYAAVTRSSCDW